jgi:hypothetical protein
MNSLQIFMTTLTQTPYLAAAVMATFALLALEALIVSRHGRNHPARDWRETPR